MATSPGKWMQKPMVKPLLKLMAPLVPWLYSINHILFPVVSLAEMSWKNVIFQRTLSGWNASCSRIDFHCMKWSQDLIHSNLFLLFISQDLDHIQLFCCSHLKTWIAFICFCSSHLKIWTTFICFCYSHLMTWITFICFCYSHLMTWMTLICFRYSQLN